MSSFLELFGQYRESEAPALVCGEARLSYAQLYRRSAALSRILRAHGVGMCSTAPDAYDIFRPESAAHSPWVIIISRRSVDAVVGILATWMAGGAFVLVGADVPLAYLDTIIEDTGGIVLQDGDFCPPETDEGAWVDGCKENEIACAVYTSGSTGVPKGAVLEHRTINEMLDWQTKTMRPETMSATACFAPFGFIAAIWELFFPLANGLTLHVLDEDTRHDLFALEQYIEHHRIAYLFLPPNVAEPFTKNYAGQALAYLRVAGGRLDACGDPGDRYEILYHLGMAENGGSVTVKSIRSALRGDIPIGTPWHNTQVHLDDENGEMLVSGPSLFRGYLASRAETERCLTDGVYHSGDLAQWNESGELVHRGRNDWIVKIRNMRVSPMQVEAAVCACAGVRECCVAAQDDALVAWFAGTEDVPVAELRTRLPAHMIPATFIRLHALPRNRNGKIDRRALMDSLPKPTETADTLFAHVLGIGVGEVGDEDSFLSLGGDSLKLMRLQAEIASALGKSVSYADLSQNLTPRKLSELIKNSRSVVPIPKAAPQEAYPLSAPMRQMWLLWRTGQDEGKYTVSIRCRFAGTIDRARVDDVLGELVERNAILRSHFIERGGQPFQVIGDSVSVTVTDSPRRVFDLSKAPLLDVTLGEDTLMFTTHHIIADAIGLRTLMEDFWTQYGGEPTLDAAQVHDITVWTQGREDHTQFWTEVFRDGVVASSLPNDLPRPKKLMAVAAEVMSFNADETERLSAFAQAHNVTLFQLFLAGYAMLLCELCGGPVSIGVPFAGREHVDTIRTVGMLVRTLPVVLDMSGLDLEDALAHVRTQFLSVQAHQNMSTERLSALLRPSRTAYGNPFYAVMINFVPLPRPLPDACGLHPEVMRGGYPGAMFDLVLDVREEAGGVSAMFSYASELFCPETVRGWVDAFGRILEGAQGAHGAAQALCGIWQSLLGVPSVAPHDDFFAQGATSLDAIRTEAALLDAGWLLSASDIFEHPTFADMLSQIKSADDIDWEAD